MQSYIQLGNVSGNTNGTASDNLDNAVEKVVRHDCSVLHGVHINHLVPAGTLKAPHVADVSSTPNLNYFVAMTTEGRLPTGIARSCYRQLAHNRKPVLYEIERCVSPRSRFRMGRESSHGIKRVALLKRRADISYKEFRDYYEHCHAPLAERTLPGIAFYARNFILRSLDLESVDDKPCEDPEFDVITELCFSCEEDHSEFYSTLVRQDIAELFTRDEEQLFDRSKVCSFLAREVFIKSRSLK